MIVISECEISEVSGLFDAAKKDRVDPRPGKRKIIWVKAVSDGVVVGFAKVIEMSATRVRLSGLYVLPSHRRKGIGYRLVEHVVSLRRDIDLFCYQQDLYKTFGFEAIRETTTSNGRTYYMIYNKELNERFLEL